LIWCDFFGYVGRLWRYVLCKKWLAHVSALFAIVRCDLGFWLIRRREILPFYSAADGQHRCDDTCNDCDCIHFKVCNLLQWR